MGSAESVKGPLIYIVDMSDIGIMMALDENPNLAKSVSQT